MEEKKVEIIDMPMGEGKTNGIINIMNSNANKKYLYIAPFLDECGRIKTCCPALHFRSPSDDIYGSKLADLKRLLAEGSNIVSTHALFAFLDSKCIEYIMLHEYTLVLDEAYDPIDEFRITKDDMNAYEGVGVIEKKQDNMIVCKKSSYKGTFKSKMTKIKNHNVFEICKDSYIQTYNCEIFKSFSKVYVLTYMFVASRLRCYFALYNIAYQYAFIQNDQIILGKYDDIEFRKTVKNLISIYEGPLNIVGSTKKGSKPLSSTWYKKNIANEQCAAAGNAMKKYFKHYTKSTKDTRMWSCFSGINGRNMKKMSEYSYKGGFVACNCRATNKHVNKTDLAYMINVYENPMIKQFLVSQGVSYDEDGFALTMLLQWIFRSGIRNRKQINLFLPAERMRNLLYDYLNV